MPEYQLYLGDCLDILPTLEDESVDAILTDVPYGTTACKWDVIIPLEPMWKEVKRVLRKHGVFVSTTSQPFTSVLTISNIKWFKHEWIWIKNRAGNFANTIREPFKEHETVLVFSKGKWTYNKQMQERTGGGKTRVKYEFHAGQGSDNYREFSRGQNPKQGELRVPSSWQKFNVEVGLHPTQKPVALYEYLVKTYTNEGNTVLDFCMGSGTTGVAALKLGRKFIGIEKEPKYFAIAAQRITDALKEVESA